MRSRAIRAGVCGLSLLGATSVMPFEDARAAKLLGSCGFDLDTLSFRGNKPEQAKCLLRLTLPAGHLAPQLKTLPAPLEKVAGTPFVLKSTRLCMYLAELKIGANPLGGGLDDPLSHSAAGNKPSARYFGVHDVCHNVCDKKADLLRSDDPMADWSLASKWANNPEAHLCITRDGKLVAPQGRTFSVPYPATKLEQQDKSRTRGLFLHVENVQLRTVDVAPGEPAEYVDVLRRAVGSVPKRSPLLNDHRVPLGLTHSSQYSSSSPSLWIDRCQPSIVT